MHAISLTLRVFAYTLIAIAIVLLARLAAIAYRRHFLRVLLRISSTQKNPPYEDVMEVLCALCCPTPEFALTRTIFPSFDARSCPPEADAQRWSLSYLHYACLRGNFTMVVRLLLFLTFSRDKAKMKQILQGDTAATTTKYCCYGERARILRKEGLADEGGFMERGLAFLGSTVGKLIHFFGIPCGSDYYTYAPLDENPVWINMSMYRSRKNSEGMAPLRWAHELYIGDGIINERDRRGHTPLYYAVENRRDRIVWALLFHGADTRMLSAEVRAAWIPYTHQFLDQQRALWSFSDWKGFAEIRLLNDVGEWRPRRHTRFPPRYRHAARTIVILAKARVYAERERVRERESERARACAGKTLTTE
jgi:hypothetical protein